MSEKYISHSLLETQNFAIKFTKRINKGTVIALIGDLGTGKTAFTQAFAKAMGVAEDVGSPTFKLVSEYEGSNIWIYHIDCYRLENPQQFINIGGEEYLYTEKGITLIEWANIVEEILPSDTIFLRFKRIVENPDYREIQVN